MTVFNNLFLTSDPHCTIHLSPFLRVISKQFGLSGIPDETYTLYTSVLIHVFLEVGD